MFNRRNATGSISKRMPEYAWLLLATCLLAFLPLAPSAFYAQDGSVGSVISSQASLVVLPVAVSDRDGRFVSGLDASSFRVYENDQPQTITLFRHEDLSVTTGLVVDHSESMVTKRDDVVAGAQAFAQAGNPQDREFVVNFNDTVSFGLPMNTPFTNNPDDLRPALSSASAIGRTALYDALIVALEHLRNVQGDKKVLLLISDGGDDVSQHNFAQVLRLARSTNVVIYAVGLLDDQSVDQNPGVLKKLVSETGGRAYFPTSAADVVNVCKDIAADIRHQYTLGYSPPENRPSGYRKIQVSVAAPGRGKLFVRTRAGYFLPSGTPAQPSAAPRQDH